MIEEIPNSSKFEKLEEKAVGLAVPFLSPWPRRPPPPTPKPIITYYFSTEGASIEYPYNAISSLDT